MEKNEPSFESFLFDVIPPHHPFVHRMHERMLAYGCAVKLQMAKNGYVVSYVFPKPKRVVLNYVFRKRELFARVYGDHAQRDGALMDALTDAMAASVAKAPACKRLIDPSACSPNCAMGYDFELRGERVKKCRYNCFLFKVDDESIPVIEALMEAELAARQGGAAPLAPPPKGYIPLESL